ncbi:MAG: hypothetical protein H7837_02535 [Magnetococcus sp. MYC-9]
MLVPTIRGMSRSAQSIPLLRTELTLADERAVRQQLARQPFQDDPLLGQWEATWEGAWQRAALAFADPAELMLTMKRLLGWQDGDWIGVDPLLDPAWVEALAANWLHTAWRDVEPHTGQGRGAFVTPPAVADRLRAGFCQHPFGLPAAKPMTGEPPCWLEEISAVLSPLAGCGWGDIQLLHLTGNRMVAAGGSCLLLSRDETLVRQLRTLRHHPPSPMACALGLSQWGSLEERLLRRQQLAERYRMLRGDGCFQRPPEGERAWEMFVLSMSSVDGCLDLQDFLHASHIRASSPLWFQPNLGQPLPLCLSGWSHFQQHALAVPLYASLVDSEHKRIINRVNRWVGRGRSSTRTSMSP